LISAMFAHRKLCPAYPMLVMSTMWMSVGISPIWLWATRALSPLISPIQNCRLCRREWKPMPAIISMLSWPALIPHWARVHR
tara:strand:- start:35735 stop:35980 length:246 start_codon:yes stop_codon:yes gene_type:complete